MKKKALHFTLLGVAMLASAIVVSACSGDDDDDDDGGSQPVLSQADGGTADFTTCTTPTGGVGMVSVKVEVGKQGLDTTADPVPTPGAVVVVFDPQTGTTSGTAVTTDANGLANIMVPASDIVTFKVTRPADGSTIFVPAYDYAHETPATTDTAGDPVFELRIIPESVRNAIAAILGPPVASLAGTTSFAGTVRDCSGEPIVGATITIGGQEPPRCSSSSALPCVSYSTNTGEDYTEESGQVFVLGLPGTGNTTIVVQGLLTDGGTATQVGSLSIRGVPDSIALGAIPAQNAN